MENNKSKQHVQLPNNMSRLNLEPKDQLIYLSIRRFINNDTQIAYPSLATISKVSGACIKTVRSSIKRLEDKEYFKVIKEGRRQKYKFNRLKEFEPFSYDFLDKTDLSFTEKAYLAASQQFMFTDEEGKGKISYSNKELSNKINMSESTISKVNRSLERKQYLTILKNKNRDIETGCKTDTKIFDLNKLGQAIIWVLNNHEERISENTENIAELKKTVDEQQKIINKLTDFIEEKCNTKITFAN